MNSDLSRLISLRCVTSSRSVTAPTSLPSASFIGVERIRNARRAPSTAQGSTAAALSDATGRLRPQHVDNRLRDPRIARDLADRFAEQLRAGAEQAFRRRIDPRDQAVGVGDEHRVVERIDGGLGRLLRDEQLAEIRTPQLADPLGHPIEADRERADLVGRRTGTAVSSSPAAIRVVAAVSCRTGPADGARQPDFDGYAGRHERDGQPKVIRNQRRAMADGGIRFPAHRLLVQAQQPIAVGAHRD